MTNEESNPERRLRTGRLEAFSDGVFAIAVTLLVLEISVPPGSEDHLLDAVVDQWPSYLAYVVSFSTIGAVWLAHSAITEYLHGANTLLIRLNLLLLMVVSFLPFPTRLLAEYLGDDDPARVAATIYGLTLLAAAMLLAVLWQYAVNADLVRPEAADEEIRMLTTRLTPGLGGYVVLIIVGLFLPTAAILGYLLIAIALIVPFGLRKVSGAGGSAGGSAGGGPGAITEP
jgi:TMEM175 potassium channel family protein